MIKRNKKIIKYIFFCFIIIIILIIFPIFSYHKEININPLQSFYKKGAYHMHSIFSDGKGTIYDITKAASQLKLDFVILTDHGEPNIKASKSTSWLSDVLLIGGSEFSLNSGHLAAIGYKIPEYIFPPEPQQSINEVINDNGVCFISHPFDDKIPWTDWDIKDFTGIEILNSYSSARKTSILNLLSFPLQYIFNSNYALLKTIQYPEENIKKFDYLCSTGKYYGIYALDCHAKLPISKKIQFNFPSYKAMFEIFNIYVKIDKKIEKDPYKSASTIVSSLRKGAFFSVIEAIAPANGFEIYFITSNRERIEMGGSTDSIYGKIVVKLPFNFETNIIIKRDGKIDKKIQNNLKHRLEIPVKKPGVYRAEIFVINNKFNKIPWIFTNPFFIGYRNKFQEKIETNLKKLLVDIEGFFKVENNRLSTGDLTYNRNSEGELITTFKFNLQKEREKNDFWSVISNRNRFDLSRFKGFLFKTRSNKKMRFWIEFRTKTKNSETWYRHSFLSDKEWKKTQIPFDKFYVIFGNKRAPELNNISSIFFSINNANAFSGTEGTIYLKNIGLY